MHDDNPYAAPDATVDDTLPQERLPIEAAGRWRRFFNWMIDRVCFTLLILATAFVYAIWLDSQGDAAGLAAMEEEHFLRDLALTFGAMLVYYIPMEGFFGLTIGKLVTGTRVVDEHGGRPTWGQVVGRTFSRLIPFEPFSVLFSTDGKIRGWHDSLSGTWVVRRRR